MSNNLQPKAILRRALCAVLGTQMMGLPVALAQQATNAPVKMEKTVVTGSLIPTAETVGPAPVEIIGSEKIQQVGSQDVLATLKALTLGFAGNANIGQSLNNGGYGESYIALRNLPTLVLIDGQRLNISPFSTFVGTFAPDLNLIPVSMIDRIEVLKDGASTIYGSDAIGGVINIITKKDFNGAEVSAHYGFGLDKGNYNEYRFSIVAGYSKDGTRIVAGGQYYYADPLYTKDRSIGSLSPQQLGAAGLNAPSYVSPSYPGRVGTFILAGSPLAVGAPGYIAGLNAPPVVAGGPFNTVQAYNNAALSDPTWSAAHPGLTPYIPITSTPASQALGGTASILNTTLLNTMTLQRQDRRTGFANVEQDILGNHLTAYGQLIYSENESSGQLAPAPIPALTLYNLTVPANNPYNVFGTTQGTGSTNASLGIRSRLIETGNRLFATANDFWHFVGGVRSEEHTSELQSPMYL